MTVKREVGLNDGRVIVAYDMSSGQEPGRLTLVWHHGSPQSGAPLEPLLAAATVRDIRIVSYARPSYGGSSPKPGRDVASAAADVAAVVDALGIDRFALMGASGGGAHALACAALLKDRVVGAVTLASPAPYTQSFDWFGGMIAPGGLRAATHGRDARALYAETAAFDPNSFIAADWAALEGTWSSLGQDAASAGSAWPDGLIDDDVALTEPWGFDPAAIQVPVLLVQGGLDRVIPPSHADWLVHQIPTAELWLRPRDGHISVLEACTTGMDWLLFRAGLR